MAAPRGRSPGQAARRSRSPACRPCIDHMFEWVGAGHCPSIVVLTWCARGRQMSMLCATAAGSLHGGSTVAGISVPVSTVITTHCARPRASSQPRPSKAASASRSIASSRRAAWMPGWGRCSAQRTITSRAAVLVSVG
ncbi:hypothetical protein CSX11_16900 [Mycobacterium goodii]|nr:hypothetical protein CSX11_16900 [Mycolicibacterium goodii]